MEFQYICVKRLGEETPVVDAPPAIAEMRSSGHPFAIGMADVIEAVIEGRVEVDEASHFDALEARRAELEASEENISYFDFGAATRDATQTPEEMYAGVERSRTVGHLCRRTSKPYRSAMLLHKLLRKTKPQTCLELGTCLGISACYQAAALELNGEGRLITMEGAEPVAALAQQTIDKLGHDRVSIVVGRFQDTLDGVLKSDSPFDYAFVDGHHEGPATIDYCNRIFQVLTDEAVVVMDDIRWSDSMLDSWHEMKQHPNVEVSIDLADIGILLVSKTPQPARHYLIP
ncbi:MAG: class I SAM-dependent methyltransferase [Gammaproteobacteria bacterium]|nr:class I SAM-dependent methyltransferase [Gammaproteobacteria bacterium]